MVDGWHGLEPFSRDKLFLSIYESCKHRPSAIDDATALAQTIAGRAIGRQKNGLIRREDIIDVTGLTLGRFDKTSAAVYAAFHPLARPETTV